MSGPHSRTTQLQVVAIVPAAGKGERLGLAVPKALVAVRGVSLLRRAVNGLLESGAVSAVVVAAPADQVGAAAAEVAEFGSRCHVVPGGGNRTESVRLALDSVEPGTYDAVLVHDAARAFTPHSVIRSVVDAITAGAPAAVPVLDVADTIKIVDAAGVITATQDRSALRQVQTPQGFAEPVLRAAYAAATDEATDDAGLVERIGEKVHTVPGHPYAMKITTSFDLAVAESVLAGEQP